MRQPWRDTPRAVSSPLPIQSTSSSSDEGDAGLMFAMSFSENYDDSESFSQNGHLDHSLHPSVLFHRAREQSARASMGSARGGTPCYNHKKRPQMVQPLYSFPEPSVTSNDSSTSPDSPISTRWPNHSFLKHSSRSGSKHTASDRRYGPINHSSATDYHREHLAYTSTDGDENEEDDAEYSSDTNEVHSALGPASSSRSGRQNYPFHVSTPKNDADDHPIDDRRDCSQRGKYDVQDEPYIAVVHENNKFEAHIYPRPVQPLVSNAKHSRHRSTHDSFTSIPPLGFVKSSSQNPPRETEGGRPGVPTTINRPRANTGGGYRVSAPRHPLMSRNTATSYVSNSILIPPGTHKADSQNLAVAFTSLKINDIDVSTPSRTPRFSSRKL